MLIIADTIEAAVNPLALQALVVLFNLLVLLITLLPDCAC